MDDIQQGNKLIPELQETVQRLYSQGIIERTGRGKGTKYILSKQYYTFTGERGIYTREKGLSSEEKKALILKHLEHHKTGTIQEFEQIFPRMTRSQIHNLLKSLKKNGKIEYIGSLKGGFWKLTY